MGVSTSTFMLCCPCCVQYGSCKILHTTFGSLQVLPFRTHTCITWLINSLKLHGISHLKKEEKMPLTMTYLTKLSRSCLDGQKVRLNQVVTRKTQRVNHKTFAYQFCWYAWISCRYWRVKLSCLYLHQHYTLHDCCSVYHTTDCSLFWLFPHRPIGCCSSWNILGGCITASSVKGKTLRFI